ncbi:hypothetical protein QCA50_007257 [Cerrena zonata]|uniref:Uncharacterized protein n=1 Tax=Cerrena zonata TaxID=2478898 RepID=A0AAW0GE84_9APHY
MREQSKMSMSINTVQGMGERSSSFVLDAMACLHLHHSSGRSEPPLLPHEAAFLEILQLMTTRGIHSDTGLFSLTLSHPRSASISNFHAYCPVSVYLTLPYSTFMSSPLGLIPSAVLMHPLNPLTYARPLTFPPG